LSISLTRANGELAIAQHVGRQKSGAVFGKIIKIMDLLRRKR
jgi:hypothetical protein